MKKIFIAQAVLDSMFEKGQAVLQADRLHITSKQDQVFAIKPACKFLYVSDGSADPFGMLGKIYATEDLESMKADVYMDSVLFRDVAYQVEPGYLGEPVSKAAVAAAARAEQAARQASAPPQAPAAPAPIAQPVSAPVEKPAADATDADLLGEYLLKVL